MTDELEFDFSPNPKDEKPRKLDAATQRRILEERSKGIKMRVDLMLSESAERSSDFTDARLNELCKEYENLVLDANELENLLFDDNGGEDN